MERLSSRKTLGGSDSDGDFGNHDRPIGKTARNTIAAGTRIKIEQSEGNKIKERRGKEENVGKKGKEQEGAAG